ncbi:MAG: tyrosine-type recombinase/integrase [Gammaproteobacteria bacterium]
MALSQDEIRRLLRRLTGVHWLAACLMYGSGLRLMECMRLRVKDLDYTHRALIVRDGNGGKDRVVTLPEIDPAVTGCPGRVSPETQGGDPSDATEYPKFIRQAIL